MVLTQQTHPLIRQMADNYSNSSVFSDLRIALSLRLSSTECSDDDALQIKHTSVKSPIAQSLLSGEK